MDRTLTRDTRQFSWMTVDQINPAKRQGQTPGISIMKCLGVKA